MRTNETIAILAVLSLASLAQAQPDQDELKQRILKQAQSMSPDDYAFTRKVRTEQTALGGKVETEIKVEKFDPTKPAAERWTLVSVDGAPPATGALKRYRKEAPKRRVAGYHRLARYFGSPSTVTADSRGRTLFRFDALPKETVTVLDADVSQNSVAEATVGEANGVPFAEWLRVSVKPMWLKLVIKVQKFNTTSRYRMGPEGKPLLIEQVSDLEGAGMGMEGKVHTEITYSEHRAVREQR
jgi:hypothetical protein